MIKSNLRNSLIFMILCCCFFALVTLYSYDFHYYDKENLILVLSIAFIVICSFCFKRDNLKQLRKQYFRVSNLFFLGFLIVHFQFYFDLILGNFDLSRLDLIIDQSILIKSAIISSIALVCFCLGYVFKLKKRIHISEIKLVSRLNIVNLNGLKILIVIFFIGFILTTPTSYYYGGYSSIELNQLSYYFQSFLVIAIIGYLILNTRNLFLVGRKAGNFLVFIKFTGVFLTVLIVLYCFLVMISGDRGPILQLVSAYIGCYCILNRKKYNVFFIFSTIVIAAFVISFLAYFRHYEGTGSFVEMVKSSSEMKADAVSSSLSVSPSTFELSKSVRTMHASVLYTENNGHTYGVFQGFQLIGIIPGLGGVITNFFGIDTEMLRSSRFLTEQLDADHGLGTTAVADIWLDFGIIGIIIGFFLFGLFIRKIDEYTYSHLSLNIFWYIIIIVFVAKSFYIGRSTILILFRDVVYGYLILFVGIYLMKFSNNNIRNH